MASNPSHVRVVRHGLDDAGYLGLLRDYLAWRLDLDAGAKGDAELIENLVEAADRRFAQVSFLADRRKSGLVPDEDLRRLAYEAKARRAGRSDHVESEAAPLDSGPNFYRLWLLDLDREYRRKLAESVRFALAALSAVEEAHDWVFCCQVVASRHNRYLTPMCVAQRCRPARRTSGHGSAPRA